MALKKYDDVTWVTEYLNIIQLPQDPKRRTSLWIVRTKYDETLGNIHWFYWRKYVFAPVPGCVFESDCLRDIAQFIEERTNDQRQKAHA